MENRFSPYYATQTDYPYAQYPAGVTYPGNTILAVSGPKQIGLGVVLALFSGLVSFGLLNTSNYRIVLALAIGLAVGGGAYFLYDPIVQALKK